jgi:RNA polymerase sigma-70 factor (ECF subfamily)
LVRDGGSAAGGGCVAGLGARQLELLWRTLGPRLLRLARRVTRDPVGAEDVVQRAFEQAWRHAARFRGEAAPGTWLHRIVVSQALMWLREERRRTRRTQLTADGEVDRARDPAAGPLERLLRAEQEAFARRALARLPQADRRLLLRCAEGKPAYAVLAAESGQRPAALKSRAFRARRRLGDAVAALESGATAASGRERVAGRLPEGHLEKEAVRRQCLVRVAGAVAEVLDRAPGPQEVQ